MHQIISSNNEQSTQISQPVLSPHTHTSGISVTRLGNFELIGRLLKLRAIIFVEITQIGARFWTIFEMAPLFSIWATRIKHG